MWHGHSKHIRFPIRSKHFLSAAVSLPSSHLSILELDPLWQENWLSLGNIILGRIRIRDIVLSRCIFSHYFPGVLVPSTCILHSWFIETVKQSHFYQSDLARPQKFILPGFSFALGAIISIAADTFYFSPNPILWRPVITPWSNFKYNVNALNLAEHGLHPPWTHLLVNLPCLLGPALLIPLISTQSFRSLLKQLAKDTCFLCCISGLTLLSSRPHQEFRFLLPIIPLLLVSLSGLLPADGSLSARKLKIPRARTKLEGKMGDPKRLEHLPQKGSRRYYGWCGAWISFNLLAGIFMGSLHQSAIVPTTQYLSNRIRQNPLPGPCLHPDMAELPRQTRMIWHRTYPAPDWLFAQPLAEPKVSIEILNLGGKWNRLWELLAESAKVPLEEARVEQDQGGTCDAWSVSSNHTLQRYYFPLHPWPSFRPQESC